MAAVADNKQIDLANAAVHIEHRISEGKPWVTEFGIHIDLGDGLTEREQKILFNSARHGDVHKMLSGEFAFNFHQVTSRPGGSGVED